MNVVTVNDFANANGGAAQVAISTSAALGARGHKVRFFAGIGPIDPRLSGMPVRCLGRKPYNRGGSAMRSISDPESKSSFIDFMADLSPTDTVVHVHSNRDALSPSVVSAAIEQSFTVVYTCHDYSLGCPYGAFYDHRKGQICGLRGLSTQCVTTHCNPNSYAKKLFACVKQSAQRRAGIPERLSDILFVTEFSKKVLSPYISPTTRSHVVANPVEANPETKRELSVTSPLVFLGTLNSGKDPVLAACAAKAAGVPIAFIGEGDERERILAANPGAIMHGWLEQREALEVLRTALALVFPVKWYETQGLVVQEAAALGVPSIVSQTCAAIEFVKDGVSGLHFKTGDADDLGAKIRLISDLGVSCEMGKNARAAFWANPPTMGQYLNAIEEIYRRALGG